MTTKTPEAPQAPSQAEPLIKLSTLAPVRPTVEVDDTDYPLRLLEYDFGIEVHQEFERDIAEFDELWSNKDKLNSKQRKRLKALLEGIFGRVVDMPADVAVKLSDVQKRQVISVFQIAPALVESRAHQETETETEVEARESSTLAS